MRLQQYIITEKLSDDERYKRSYGMYYDEIATIIETECSIVLPYIKSSGFLYRGSSSESYKVTKVKSRSGVRKPRNTVIEVHRALNKLFSEKFGWKVRDGIFVTGSIVQTTLYGDVYLFFPVGKFKYVWSSRYSDLFKSPSITPSFGIKTKDYISQKEKTFKRIVNTYKNTNLEDAIKSGNEISFKCGEYWMFPHTESLRKFLLNRWI